MKLQHFFLLIICVVFMISHVAYVVKSRQYPQWDEHIYMTMMTKNYDNLSSKGIFSLSEIINSKSNRQPLYPFILTIPILLLGLGSSYKLVLLINGLFYIISIIGTYYLSREFFDETVSLLAAFVFATLGNALFYSHFAYTETAVTSFIVWSMVLMHRTEGFTKTKHVFLSALLSTCATLTRWIAPVFIIGGIFHFRKISIKNLVVFIVIWFGLSLVLYFIPNRNEFLQYIKDNQGYGAQWVAQYRSPDMADTFSTHSVMYYFNILSQNTVFIFLAFMLGLISCLKNIKKTFPLIISFLIPYMFLTFITIWKEDRFLVPLYPIFAIITASSILLFNNRMIKKIIITFLIVLSVLNSAGAVWAVGPMGMRGLTDVVLPSFIHHPRRIYLTPLVWPPNPEYINAHQLFEIIGNTSGRDVIQLFDYEPWDNAINSILTYEKRGWFKIQHSKNLEQQTATYVLTKNVELDSNSMYHQIGKIYVPIDNSNVYIYSL